MTDENKNTKSDDNPSRNKGVSEKPQIAEETNAPKRGRSNDQSNKNKARKALVKNLTDQPVTISTLVTIPAKGQHEFTSNEQIKALMAQPVVQALKRLKHIEVEVS